MATAVHLGMYDLEGMLNFEEEEDLLSALSAAGFLFDGDSYIEWGEEGEPWHPRHVVYVTSEPVTVDVVRDLQRQLMALMRVNFVYDSRLVDYVAITDNDDWSENSHLYLGWGHPIIPVSQSR